MERDFKGIWIPKEIWLSNELTLQEKVFLVEITSLDNDKGCYANNAYFAEFFGLSKKRVSEVINEMVSKGYIISSIDNESHRTLRVSPSLKTSTPPPEKCVPPLPEKVEHSNTYNNTINNNIAEFKKLADKESGNVFPYFLYIFLDLGWKPTKDDSVESLKDWMTRTLKNGGLVSPSDARQALKEFHAYWETQKGTSKKKRNWKSTLLNSYNLPNNKLKYANGKK